MRASIGATLLLSVVTFVAATSSAAVPVAEQRQSNDARSSIVPFLQSFACTVWSNRPSCESQALLQSRVRDDVDDDDEGATHTQGWGWGRRRKSGWVYLIRHGEKFKDSDKTGLSVRGVRRARCLRGVFGRRGHKIDYILAQDFKPDGRRRRPYETVHPLARAFDIPLDHSCDRDDEKCAARKIERASRERDENVLVVWEHARLTDIAERLGVRGLQYPSERYDVVFKIRNGKVHAIYSEECNGLDEEWFNWHGKKKGRHGKGGKKGRLIDDESWAQGVREEPDDVAA